MRTFAPLLLILALVGVGAWLLLGNREEPATFELEPAGAPPTRDAPAPLGAGRQAPVLAAAAPAPSAPKARPAPVVIDPRTLPVGSLEVVVLGPDDLPIPHDDLRVMVEPGKGSKAWHTTPLLRPDPDTNAWKGDDIFAGPVRVRISGDSIVAQDVETRVTVEPGEPLRVHVDRAGQIEYTVTRYGDEPPAEVTLTLLDEGGKPVRVGYQVRTETVVTQSQHVREIKQGPVGIVFGIPPGCYTLRATSPADESAETQVSVEARKAVSVTLQVRR